MVKSSELHRRFIFPTHCPTSSFESISIYFLCFWIFKTTVPVGSSTVLGESKWKLQPMSAVSAPNPLWTKQQLYCRFSLLQHGNTETSWVAAMSRLTLQWQNAVFLQQVLFTEMPGKQDFVILPLGESKYTQECFAKPGNTFKKRAWALLGNNRLIVKTTWNKFIQCPMSVL